MIDDEDQATEEDEIVEDAAEQVEQGIKEKATALGWKSEADWKGDPPAGGFVDAETFMERSHVIRQARDGLRGEIDVLKAELTGLQSQQKVQADWQEKIRADEYERALETVRAEQATAFEADDEAAYKAARQKENEMKPPETAPVPESAPSQGSMAFVAWRGDNPWYDTDSEMRHAADFFADKVKQSQSDLTEAEFYSQVTDRMKQVMPDKFESSPAPNPPRSPEGGNSGGNRRGGSGNGKSWRDVPSEDRRAAENAGFFGDGCLYANDAKGQAQYAESYFREV